MYEEMEVSIASTDFTNGFELGQLQQQMTEEQLRLKEKKLIAIIEALRLVTDEQVRLTLLYDYHVFEQVQELPQASRQALASRIIAMIEHQDQPQRKKEFEKPPTGSIDVKQWMGQIDAEQDAARESESEDLFDLQLEDSPYLRNRSRGHSFEKEELVVTEELYELDFDFDPHQRTKEQEKLRNQLLLESLGKSGLLSAVCRTRKKREGLAKELKMRRERLQCMEEVTREIEELHEAVEKQALSSALERLSKLRTESAAREEALVRRSAEEGASTEEEFAEILRQIGELQYKP